MQSLPEHDWWDLPNSCASRPQVRRSGPSKGGSWQASTTTRRERAASYRHERTRNGGLVVDAILTRDYPVIQGVLLIFSGVHVLLNLLIDLLYVVLDPRIRY